MRRLCTRACSFAHLSSLGGSVQWCLSLDSVQLRPSTPTTGDKTILDQSQARHASQTHGVLTNQTDKRAASSTNTLRPSPHDEDTCVWEIIVDAPHVLHP